MGRRKGSKNKENKCEGYVKWNQLKRGFGIVLTWVFLIWTVLREYTTSIEHDALGAGFAVGLEDYL